MRFPDLGGRRSQVRIPVAVLIQPSNDGRFGRICWVRHSQRSSTLADLGIPTFLGVLLGWYLNRRN
jgi:hypothetical protein